MGIDLCEHLKKNQDVQNIDLMNLSGFCRNCLSKWLVANNRRLGNWDYTIEQAHTEVYGMPYEEFKKKFQKKASEDQMKIFNESKDRHAKHDKNLLANPPSNSNSKERVPDNNSDGPILSDVCCQDIESCDMSAESMINRIISAQKSKSISNATSLHKSVDLKLGILTISDRAYNGVYKDDSGPEIQKCVDLYCKLGLGDLKLKAIVMKVVPDEIDIIKENLIDMSNESNLILTTGGTGLSLRDVTPEATLDVIDKEVRGIPEMIRRETSKTEPFAILSRAVAGICNNNSTLIINLPGRPKACREACSVLLPFLYHAIDQLNS